SGRVQGADAAFTLQEMPAVTIRRGDFTTGDVLETTTFGPVPARPSFNDWYGYYPGFWYPEEGGSYVYYVDRDASTVIPAMADYSIQISHFDGEPFTDLYGVPFAGYWLGDGNPGSDAANYGIHFDVEEAAPDGSWAMVHVYRYDLEYEFTADKDVILGTAEPQTFTFHATNRGNSSSPVATFTFDIPSTLEVDVPGLQATYGNIWWAPATSQVLWQGNVLPGQPLEVTIPVIAHGASTVWVTADDGAGVVEHLGWASSAQIAFQQSVYPEASYAGGLDAYIDLWNPAANFGYEHVMLARQSNIKKMLVDFDFAGYMPEGAVVLEATLTLSTIGSTNPHWQEVKVAPATAPWDFASVTWNQAALDVPWATPGGDYGDAVASALVETPGAYRWDVTDIVKSWANGSHPKYGFVLFSDTQRGAVEWRYVASEALSVAQRPLLEVQYFVP
ncbi:MAG: DNRLRE domain-containing protein, partial [Chloroflexi bacterium]|nr:DNRLRE domain-containing protein [Chloroflexota bacterium]